MNIIGDVEGHSCVIIDDLVDTAQDSLPGRRCPQGPWRGAVMAYCTHPVLSGKAVENINSFPAG